MNDLILKVNNISYGEMGEAHIHKSMNEICGAFAFSFANFQNLSDIKMDDECIIEIDNQKIINGYIESIIPSYSGYHNNIEIRGRDKTCDLVDCSFIETVNEWKGQTVAALVGNLCSPFSIPVVVSPLAVSQANIIIDNFKANEGLSVFEMISELCIMNGILPLCLNDGKLTLTTASTIDFMWDSLELGRNIIGGVLIQNNENRFSDYEVKGQGIGNDNKQTIDYIECYGSFSDAVVQRYRPFSIFADIPTNNGQCLNRAKWESRIRAGSGMLVQYELLDWIQTNGDIWEINKLVRIKDDSFGLNTTMLISDIDFILNENERKTKLTFVDKNTYSLSDDNIEIKTDFYK